MNTILCRCIFFYTQSNLRAKFDLLRHLKLQGLHESLFDLNGLTFQLSTMFWSQSFLIFFGLCVQE
jgi:hypothetical protein